MPRPLMQRGVGELEALFAKFKSEVKVLKQLEHELQYRQVSRAVALLGEVQAAISGAVPAAPAIAPAPPATAPHQAGLWERPAAPTASPFTASETQSRSAAQYGALKPSATAKAPLPPTPAMPLEDAYKLVRATAGSTWESIEQSRRQLVQQSSPLTTGSMSQDKRSQLLAQATRVNAAYAALSKHRTSTH